MVTVAISGIVTSPNGIDVNCGPGSQDIYWQFTEDCEPPSEWDDASGSCLVPFSCETLQGTVREGFYSSTEIVMQGCSGGESNDCSVVATGQNMCVGDGEDNCFGRYEFTGAVCDGDALPEGAATKNSAGTDCITADGLTFCSANSNKNCGTLNGQPVCVEGIPDGECTFLGNGGMVCASDAGAPPGPTDPTGMTPAEPDGEFKAAGDGAIAARNFNYYSPGTVGASGTDTQGSGNGGQDEFEEEPEPGECSEPGSCEGELPDLEEAPDYGESTSDYLAAVQATPIVAAVTSLATSFPVGVCPTPTLELDYLDASYTMTIHCDLWDEWSVVLSGVMLAIFVFIGGRILLSA